MIRIRLSWCLSAISLCVLFISLLKVRRQRLARELMIKVNPARLNISHLQQSTVVYSVLEEESHRMVSHLALLKRGEELALYEEASMKTSLLGTPYAQGHGQLRKEGDIVRFVATMKYETNAFEEYLMDEGDALVVTHRRCQQARQGNTVELVLEWDYTIGAWVSLSGRLVCPGVCKPSEHNVIPINPPHMLLIPFGKKFEARVQLAVSGLDGMSSIAPFVTASAVEA